MLENAGAGVQESLFATAAAALPVRQPAAPSVAEGDDRESFIAEVLAGVLGLNAGKGGLWDQLCMRGADDAEMLRRLPTMFCTGGGYSCDVRPGEEPAFVFRPRAGEGFTLSSKELCVRLRSLYGVPLPKPEREAALLVGARLEEERACVRSEARAFARRIISIEGHDRKVSDSLAASIAALLFVEGCEGRTASARACEQIYHLIEEAGFEPHKSMIAAGKIVYHARIVWESVLRRYGLLEEDGARARPRKRGSGRESFSRTKASAAALPAAQGQANDRHGSNL